MASGTAESANPASTAAARSTSAFTLLSSRESPAATPASGHASATSRKSRSSVLRQEVRTLRQCRRPTASPSSCSSSHPSRVSVSGSAMPWSCTSIVSTDSASRRARLSRFLAARLNVSKSPCGVRPSSRFNRRARFGSFSSSATRRTSRRNAASLPRPKRSHACQSASSPSRGTYR